MEFRAKHLTIRYTQTVLSVTAFAFAKAAPLKPAGELWRYVHKINNGYT